MQAEAIQRGVCSRDASCRLIVRRNRRRNRHILKIKPIGEEKAKSEVKVLTLGEGIQHGSPEPLIHPFYTLLRVYLEQNLQHGLVLAWQCLYPRLGAVEAYSVSLSKVAGGPHTHRVDIQPC